MTHRHPCALNNLIEACKRTTDARDKEAAWRTRRQPRVREVS